jgi:hypothetical protein
MTINRRICERCGEIYEEDDMDLMTIEGSEDGVWLCRSCEENIKLK